MYKLLFLEHTELELHTVAAVFYQAGILDSCTSMLTPCLATSVKASSNTVTIQPPGTFLLLCEESKNSSQKWPFQTMPQKKCQ